MTTSTIAERPRDAHGRFMKRSEAQASSTELGRLSDELAHLSTENFKLTEQLGKIQMMIDEKGWHQAYEHGADGGLSLGLLKSASLQLREMIAGNGLMKQGSEARNARIWGEGVDFFTITTRGKRGEIPARAREILRRPRNQRYLSSPAAMHELERAAFTDGNLFLRYDPATQTFIRIPIAQITADWRSPDNPEEVWAYRRVWKKNIAGPETDDNVMVRWIYTDIFDGDRQQTIQYDGKSETVEPLTTIIDQGFNRQLGWAYGIPDGLAALAWATIYKEFLVNGFVQSRALAAIAFKLTAGNNAARDAAAADIVKPGQGGGTATMSAGTDLLPLQTAGKGYDFGSGRPLAAMIAASLGVSLGVLLSDEETQGSETLDSTTTAMVVMRRQMWSSFWQRIMRLLDVTSEVGVAWHDIREEQIQRVIQSIVLANSTGLFEGDVIQKQLARAMGLAVPGDVPEGYLIPNNAKTLEQQRPADAPVDQDDPDQGRMPSAGSGQGKDAPAGGLGNDHSTDET